MATKYNLTLQYKKAIQYTSMTKLGAGENKRALGKTECPLV
jgi:hypothetical protein